MDNRHIPNLLMGASAALSAMGAIMLVEELVIVGILAGGASLLGYARQRRPQDLGSGQVAVQLAEMEKRLALTEDELHETRSALRRLTETQQFDSQLLLERNEVEPKIR